MTLRPASLAVGLLVVSAGTASAGELRMTPATVTRPAGGTGLTVTAQVSWQNSWRTAQNHDAVWLIVKLRGRPSSEWAHGRVRQGSATPSAAAGVAANCEVTSDHIGVFCEPGALHRGHVDWTLRLEVEPGRISAADLNAGTVEARVYGIEMVYVPAGPFSVGDLDPKSASFAAFYRSNATGEHAGLFPVTSEAPIRVAAEDGALYYQSRTPQYEGDQLGPVPAEFPKGTRAFYTMKYEVSQGQYADFLNSISREFSPFRSPTGGLNYLVERGTIRIENNRYVAGSPDRPANWISWDDGTAFADWAGLRPMTELEFTKAVRGPGDPVPGDYPWGSSSKDRLLRRVGADDELVRSGEADESRLTDSTRDVFGASFYWVMDLAGSVWERTVTIGHPRGRAFQGTHGDGVLRSYGQATNVDWPSGDHDAGGYGYRGGGYYERGMPDREFNPYGPTEWRRYGSWGGAPRSIAYGFRAVRTADTAGR